MIPFMSLFAGKKLAGKQGSLVTETVILLPVFILSILTISCLIKAVWIQVSVFETLTDEGRKAAVSSYVFHTVSGSGGQEADTGDAGRSAGSERIAASEGLEALVVDLAGRRAFLSSVRSGLQERGISSQEMVLEEHQQECDDFAVSGLNRVDSVYHLKIALPVSSINEIKITNTIYYRDWEGEELAGDVFPFSQMMQEEEGDLVYIFPDSGAKYHDKDCRYVNSYAEAVTVTSQILEKYDKCPLCLEQEASSGDTVYIFRYGNSYHDEDCNSVKKSVICMDRTDAAEKEYTACSVCGG